MRGHNAGRDGQFAGGFLPETIPAEALFLEQRVRCGAFSHADLASPDRVGKIARHYRALDHGVSDPRSQPGLSHVTSAVLHLGHTSPWKGEVGEPRLDRGEPGGGQLAAATPTNGST